MIVVPSSSCCYILSSAVLVLFASWNQYAESFHYSSCNYYRSSSSRYELSLSRLPLRQQDKGIIQRRRSISSSSSSSSCLNMMLRRDVQISLLDLPLDGTGNDDDDNKRDQLQQQSQPSVIVPLPSAHLPHAELRTLHMYGMQITRPVHKMIVKDATTVADDGEPVYGQIACKPDSDDGLVGAIGCTSEILVHATPSEGQEDKVPVTEDGEPVVTVLCRGSYRFIVKEVIKTIPYPVAIVDELRDSQPGAVDQKINKMDKDDNKDDEDDDDDDDYDDDDFYEDLSGKELMQRIMMGMKTFVDQKLEEASSKPELTPLEQSILEDSGMLSSSSYTDSHVEEMAATLTVFQEALIDDILDPIDRYYAVAFMAAEMLGFGNSIRCQLLQMTDGIQRLRLVLREMDREIGMISARKMAKQITDTNDEGSKDLKVGDPELPPWAKSIRKGMRVEYYWNEEWGWCGGEVVKDPVTIVNEILVTVRFDDGSTHRLPFSADEKVRWRPPRPPTTT